MSNDMNILSTSAGPFVVISALLALAILTALLACYFFL
jgi:hypothetical protein